MQHTSQRNDWLVHPFGHPASVEEMDNRLILNNGLIRRTFVTSPNFATVDYTNQITDSSLLRGIKPEAILTIDGHPFEVGGLKGQPDYAYLDSDWVYESHLAQNFGSGVIACYRGPRLFDTQQTKVVVKKWVDFYKRYRPILDSDLIHVRRPDGRSIDCALHVNAQIRPCGLAMLYNPTPTAQQIILKLPLYYTGLSKSAKIREKEGEPKQYEIDRNYTVEIPIIVKPENICTPVGRCGLQPHRVLCKSNYGIYYKMGAKSVSYLVIEPEM